MAYETIVAVFDTRAHADAAVKALRAGGFANADISIFDEDRLASGQKALAAGVKEAGLWQRLFGDDVYEHEAAVYHQTVKRGGGVVSARVMDNEVAHAIAILDLHRPVDVHDRAVAIAKQNADSAFALVERMGKAQNLQELVTLETKFAQEQMQAYAAQTQELQRLIGEALKGSARG